MGLRCRAGVDAFLCVVRNNTEYPMRPRWYFTSPEINRYLTGAIKKWDVEVIGGLFEAFAIAGCDVMGSSPLYNLVLLDTHQLHYDSLPPQRQGPR